MKTDSTGNEQWNKTFGGTGGDAAYPVQQTSDGGYILAGCTDSYGSGPVGAWLVKTDSTGNEQWNETFGETGDKYMAGSAQQTSDGGYILAGCVYWYGSGYDFWLMKTDSNGNEQWNKTFGGTGEDVAHHVQQTSDGGYILTGYTNPYSSFSSEFWLIKTDSNGNEQWNKTFGETDSDDNAMAVQQTADSGYILAGYAESYSAGDYDFWLIKVAAEESTSKKGDLNGDNEVTQADAAIALQLAVSGEWRADADISGDNHITSLDALMILQAAAGTISL